VAAISHFVSRLNFAFSMKVSSIRLFDKRVLICYLPPMLPKLMHIPNQPERRYKLLDLFCSAGGTTYGYSHHFHVTGLDHRRFYRFPFPNNFIQADAIAFLSDPNNTIAFDCFAASPPCQRYSSSTSNRESWPDYIPIIRELLNLTNKPYIIENVVGAPLIRSSAVELCGSMFGLDVERHRLFESNIPLFAPFCMHEWQLPRFKIRRHNKDYHSRVVHVYGAGGGKMGHDWNRAMEIDWMVKEELVDAIPPAYTKFLGAQMRAYLEHRELEFGNESDHSV